MTELERQGLSPVYQRQCPGSIDVKRLDACVAELNSAACTTDPEAMTRFRSCDATALCPSITPH